MTAVAALLWGAGADPVAVGATLTVMAGLGLATWLFGRSGRAASVSAASTAVRDALDQLEEAIAVETVSETGTVERVQYLNAAFARLCGVEDVPRTTLEPLLSAALASPDDAAASAELERSLRALCDGPLGTSVRHAEIDGPGPRHEARRFHVWTVPVDGRYRVWIVRDMTQVRRAAEKARDRLAVLSRALEQAPFGLILSDDDQSVREANATFRQMVGRETLSGNRIADLFREQDRAAVAAMLSGPDTGLPPGPVDASPLSAPETTLTLHPSRTAESRGGRGGALLYVLDATERKRLESRRCAAGGG